MKREYQEILYLIKNLLNIILNPPDNFHWTDSASILCDIETIIFCFEAYSGEPHTKNLSETFAKKAITLLAFSDNEIVESIARSLIAETCQKLLTNIQMMENDIIKSMYM